MNPRLILDLDTGINVPEGELLKSLMMRSGYIRKEWVELAQKGISRRLNSSPAWLSDIFNGRRTLPQRDITPLIGALKLKDSEKEHYICELLKASIDENLMRYVGPSKRTKRYTVMQKRIEQLEDRIDDLQARLYYQEHVTHFIELEKLEKSYKSVSKHFLISDSEPKKEDYSSWEEYENACIEWYADKAEEQYYEQYPEFDVLNFNELGSKSTDQSALIYKREVGFWHQAVRELQSCKEQSACLEYFAVCAPETFKKDLELFLSDDQLSMSENPLEAWGWVSKRVNFRSERYINASLLMNWANKYPKKFEQWLEFYQDNLSKPWHERKAKPGWKNSFASYLGDARNAMRSHWPSMYNLISMTNYKVLISDSLEEEVAFKDYIAFVDGGVSPRLTYDEFNEAVSPSAKGVKDIKYKLNICCASHEFCEGLGTLYNVFESYGDAQEKHENVYCFLEEHSSASDSYEPLCAITRELMEQQKSLGESKYQREWRERLASFVPKPIILDDCSLDVDISNEADTKEFNEKLDKSLQEFPDILEWLNMKEKKDTDE
ncbi:helix-turn-helix domain-containing protein [Photobacterium rosenbergii]|uniref:helix-turn-helix domain-containing protein n=1 Tax=Photobacterium rosenbergii TaxID=294936 RepID=UPI001C9994B4|nr:helix-turn-helix transcriptional regulator [Photobacterium rosenbergii]MBY5944783.1 helix-turn-helix domain-containing protein [Photobacterium rosenbergii]